MSEGNDTKIVEQRAVGSVHQKEHSWPDNVAESKRTLSYNRTITFVSKRGTDYNAPETH